ncbi:putative 1,3-beta-glucan synthase [Rosa chinensis]|uniref:Putative 1,3-beta-glucan synthase n=1 Tax=Rosa chinensis TaxID=74649 RepID=A0A2P6P5B8_ROSCH|nr:putative 1,3-beta-glucan synthase [Rosa chinensis]
MFDHMVKELDAIPAASSTIENDSVSFLKQIVYPIYETLAAVSVSPFYF